MNSHDVHVGMCEVRLGRGDQVLRSTLGSCVGIGIIWHERKISALAHCLLPGTPSTSLGLSAKYVTDAVPSLLRLLRAMSKDRAELTAVIAGGALMMKQSRSSVHGSIGEQNTRLAHQLLSESGIRIVHSQIGGSTGRQLSIHCATGNYIVRTFDRIT